MPKPIKKIALILLLIILLPAFFFSVYELSTLTENEKFLQSIYTNQLSSIIFSVNQHTDDILNYWVSEIDVAQNASNEPKGIPSLPRWKDFITRNPCIDAVYTTDSLLQNINPLYTKSDSLKNTAYVRDITASQSAKIGRLFSYKANNYFKIEPLETGEMKNHIAFAFFTGKWSSHATLSVLLVDKNRFIQQVLRPKMQVVGENKFIIGIIDTVQKQLIFETPPGDLKSFKKTEKLWMIPGYVLGIELQRSTVSEVVHKRTLVIMGMIIFLNLLIITGVIVVYRNIKKEVDLSQIKSDFVSNVSHELKTPLSLIAMFAETLESERVPTEQKKKEYYTIIGQEAQRLTKIINKILNFSQIEAGKKKYDFGKTNITQLLHEVYSSYEFHLKQKGFTFQLHSSELPVNLTIDRESIMESVINLVDSAVKYSLETKAIDIRLIEESTSISIVVEDRGIGISDKDKKRIFEKFFRVSEGDRHTTKGTGLGLSIVQNIVEAHHGKIEVQSKPGEGSTFKIILPKT